MIIIKRFWYLNYIFFHVLSRCSQQTPAREHLAITVAGRGALQYVRGDGHRSRAHEPGRPAETHAAVVAGNHQHGNPHAGRFADENRERHSHHVGARTVRPTRVFSVHYVSKSKHGTRTRPHRLRRRLRAHIRGARNAERRFDEMVQLTEADPVFGEVHRAETKSNPAVVPVSNRNHETLLN